MFFLFCESTSVFLPVMIMPIEVVSEEQYCRKWSGASKHQITYRKVVSSNTSRLDAHAGFFRLLVKGIFNPYVLRPYDKKLFS